MYCVTRLHDGGLQMYADCFHDDPKLALRQGHFLLHLMCEDEMYHVVSLQYDDGHDQGELQQRNGVPLD